MPGGSLYATKYSPDGSLVWARRLMSPSDPSSPVSTVGVRYNAATDSLTVAGTFSGTLTRADGGGSHTSLASQSG